jgi:omega-6 fatty acid desaturase (delta-12 desaturase)
VEKYLRPTFAPHNLRDAACGATSALHACARAFEENRLQNILHLPWRKMLAGFQTPDRARSVVELTITVAPFTALTACGWAATHFGLWWLALLLSVPTAAFSLRLFTIQHDCGHRSFFGSPRLNDWLGRIIGVITLTPYDCWRQEHAIHHATSGNLDRRGAGELVTLTLAEYQALGAFARWKYRLYRHPLVLFVLGPFYVFFLQQRLPVGLMCRGWRPWLSALGTNAALGLLITLAILAGAGPALLLVNLPAMLLAASTGVWLFFVQHQFEGTHWRRHHDWDATEAALAGSSHYDLPAPLRWLTANIGIHHVHHVAGRIPFYKLPAVLKRFPELRDVNRVTLWQSIQSARLALWDEVSQKLVSFRVARLRMA